MDVGAVVNDTAVAVIGVATVAVVNFSVVAVKYLLLHLQ